MQINPLILFVSFSTFVACGSDSPSIIVDGNSIPLQVDVCRYSQASYDYLDVQFSNRHDDNLATEISIFTGVAKGGNVTINDADAVDFGFDYDQYYPVINDGEDSGVIVHLFGFPKTRGLDDAETFSISGDISIIKELVLREYRGVGNTSGQELSHRLAASQKIEFVCDVTRSAFVD